MTSRWRRKRGSKQLNSFNKPALSLSAELSRSRVLTGLFILLASRLGFSRARKKSERALFSFWRLKRESVSVLGRFYFRWPLRCRVVGYIWRRFGCVLPADPFVIAFVNSRPSRALCDGACSESRPARRIQSDPSRERGESSSGPVLGPRMVSVTPAVRDGSQLP